MFKPAQTITYILVIILVTACSNNETFDKAFEEVTQTKVPLNSSLIEKHKSKVDFFGDYDAFAVYELENDFSTITKKLASISPRDTSLKLPERVQDYFNRNSSKSVVQDYRFRDRKGLELYGAALNDKKTVVIYRSSW